MKGKLTYIIALFEGGEERTAVMYGSEGNIADCFDNAVALVADGKTAAYYGGTPDAFVNAAARRMLKELQQKLQAGKNGGVD